MAIQQEKPILITATRTPTAIDQVLGISSLTEKTTLHDNDVFLIEDSQASYVRKKVKKSNVGGGGGATVTRGTFVNADLSSGILTVTDNKGLSAPYSRIIMVFDNNGNMVIPDIVCATNSFQMNFSNFGSLTGTWGYAYLS